MCSWGRWGKGNSSGNSGFSQSVFLRRIGFSINRHIPFRFSLYLSSRSHAALVAVVSTVLMGISFLVSSGISSEGTLLHRL